MNYLGKILKKINDFDSFYEMSESSSNFNKYDSIKASIENELDLLTEDELTKLNKSLNKNGKIVMERYFNYYIF